MEQPSYHLFAQTAPAEREQAELKPRKIQFTNESWQVDFERCVDGWPKLTLHSNQPGDLVRVTYFQMTGGRKPAGWDEYICRGGTETWQPNFGRHTSFQTIQVTGYRGPLDATNVRSVSAYWDAEVAGRFHCSSALLNSIYELCERSARQNVQQGIISVDANREQSPWTADSWNIGNVLLYNHRNSMVVDKVIRDYAGEQLANGDFPACSPGHRLADYLEDPEKSRRIPEWSMYWPMLLWQQYLFSGDEILLREMAPRLARFLAGLRASADASTGLIDPPGWRISEYTGSNMPGGSCNSATECQYYENLYIASRVFSVIGDSAQSDAYARQAQQIKCSINARLFTGDYYLARPDRKEVFPLASAWALRFDLEPAEVRRKILASIGRHGKPSIGGYGGDAWYSGLFNAGGGDIAVRDLARYRPMLKENKANWEQFDLGGEVNHAWTSYPGYLFLKYICGLQPTSGGFATFDVRPSVEGLMSAEGTVPTVKGDITTRWKKTAEGGLSLEIVVPANTHATICLPKISTGAFTITERGKRVWPLPGDITARSLIAVQNTDRTIDCRVSAGTYEFLETPTP